MNCTPSGAPQTDTAFKRHISANSLMVIPPIERQLPPPIKSTSQNIYSPTILSDLISPRTTPIKKVRSYKLEEFTRYTIMSWICLVVN